MSISSMKVNKQANKHTEQDMTRLNLKRSRQSKSSKPKKKKEINQVIRQVAATAANHFDDEDPCESPHCKKSEKPYDSGNDEDDVVEQIQCVDLDPTLITENFKYICDDCNDK